MFIIVMGVSGSGKNTVGELLADRLDCPFYDGDHFHPPANIAKMSAGIPLNDDDRAGWLGTLADIIHRGLTDGETGVIACSALKQRYRDLLTVDPQQVHFVYLKGSYDLIWERMQRREGHYMKASMLQSQFAALEEPADALTFEISQAPQAIVEAVLAQLNPQGRSIGLLGLGVMGRSLALNLHRNGFKVIGFDPFPRLPADFPVSVAESPAEMAAALSAPRLILMMVPAGDPVDAAIASLLPHLQEGDIIVDGGNSYFTDSERRSAGLAELGIHFVGMGVSGGESGALWGPSLMPGGADAARPYLLPVARAIAAVADDGAPCAAWVGPGGSGHYVKMVHNGIEYADMQLIAEIYDLLHRGAGLSNAELAAIFAQWNEGELKSYLVEITAAILARVDEESGQSLVDLILDEAAQKGTGKWTAQTSLDVGAAIPTINSAVQGRLLSGLREQRKQAARLYGTAATYQGDVGALVQAAQDALYASKVLAYAQGTSLLRVASEEYDWSLDLGAVIRLWRAGCIIRAGLLEEIAAVFDRQPHLSNLLLDEGFAQNLRRRQGNWRKVVLTAVELGLPVMSISASLAYFDAYRSERLPANLIQAQRDYFGAHTYRRVDQEGQFHTHWESATAGEVL